VSQQQFSSVTSAQFSRNHFLLFWHSVHSSSLFCHK